MSLKKRWTNSTELFKGERNLKKARADRELELRVKNYLPYGLRSKNTFNIENVGFMRRG